MKLDKNKEKYDIKNPKIWTSESLFVLLYLKQYQ